MLAMVCTRYGPPEVLRQVEMPKPVPDSREICIKLYATTVSAADVRVRGFVVPPSFWLPARLLLGFRKPRKSILGIEMSGVVESIGSRVRGFKPGDPVVAFSGHSHFGGYAQYLCLPENSAVVLKPANLTHAEAAAMPFGGLTAWHFLSQAKIRPGQKVMIYGASGSVGTAAVQLAKYFGAEVAAVCSTANLELVKTLGADRTIDYLRENFAEPAGVYDVFFDTVGKSPLASGFRLLRPGGVYLHAVATPGMQLRAAAESLLKGKRFVGGTFAPQAEHLERLMGLAAAGKFKPVIDASYPLARLVEAHRYVDQGHKKGNIVINLP